MATIFLRTVFIYFLLLCMMRLTGKRQIGELQVAELVTAFLLSEIVSLPLTNPGIPLLYAVIPTVTIVCLEILFSYWTLKSEKVKKLLDAAPGVLIHGGKLQKSVMESMRIPLDDILREMRLAGIADIGEIRYAILESNGKISFFKKTDAPLSHALILDGKWQKRSLHTAGIGKTQAADLLRQAGIADISDVFLLSVTDGGNLTVIRQGDTQ